jgi:nucleoside-diphosphate-sugar epimerase
VEAIAGTRCLITGAGGFIGTGLCRRLSKEGAQVIGVDASPQAAAAVRAAGARFIQCDISDREGLAAAFEGAELVVHTAAIVSDWGEMDDYIRVNVRGTRNVLDAARDVGARRVVHLSSVVTFGFEHDVELDEDAAARPAGIPYIDTKGASDELARARATRGEPIVVLRPGDVYGPGSKQWAVRPLEAIRSRQFALVGKGEGLILPTYVDDLIESIVLALTVPGAEGAAITVWDGHAVTSAEFFNHYAQMLGKDRIPSLPAPVVAVAGAAQELVARFTGKPPAFSRNAMTFVSRRAPLSNRRARELLGWKPSVSLDEGMKRTETWFRETGLL